MSLTPPRLRQGDTIAIISPSWGGAGAFPHRVQAGIRQIETMGYQAVLSAHALNQSGWVSDSPENRAADMHACFANPHIRAIVSAIGGDHACQLLPFLDFDLIRQNPKIFMGFSDTTVLNVAIHAATGLITFNGPALLTDFAEHPQMFEYTLRCITRTLSVSDAPGPVEPSPTWTEEFLDWESRKDLERPRQMQSSPGWTWLKPGTVEGPLMGGCIESLQHLRGTRFWPDWRGKIFFWETSEEKPLPETVDGMLMDYENMGVLEQIGGMLVGRPMRYSADEKQTLREIILERTRHFSFPVITDMDFGHTSPQMVLPLGVRARIDSTARQFAIVEPAVREAF